MSTFEPKPKGVLVHDLKLPRSLQRSLVPAMRERAVRVTLSEEPALAPVEQKADRPGD